MRLRYDRTGDGGKWGDIERHWADVAATAKTPLPWLHATMLLLLLEPLEFSLVQYRQLKGGGGQNRDESLWAVGAQSGKPSAYSLPGASNFPSLITQMPLSIC